MRQGIVRERTSVGWRRGRMSRVGYGPSAVPEWIEDRVVSTTARAVLLFTPRATPSGPNRSGAGCVRTSPTTTATPPLKT